MSNPSTSKSVLTNTQADVLTKLFDGITSYGDEILKRRQKKECSISVHLTLTTNSPDIPTVNLNYVVNRSKVKSLKYCLIQKNLVPLLHSILAAEPNGNLMIGK